MRSEELHIADFCLHYLNFGCFDAAVTDSEIREFLRLGYYSFEDYAIAHWLDHVESSTFQTSPLEADRLECSAQRIESFFTKHGLKLPSDPSAFTDQRFQSVRHWDFTKRLEGLAQLAHQKESNEMYLDLETQLRRRRSIYEDIITNTDPHSELLPERVLLNGSGFFKCPKTWCGFFFEGFQHKESRDKHVNQHERPFRCSFEECMHAKLGYGTEKELRRHEKSSHPTDQSSEWTFPTQRPKKKSNIFSACKRGDLATVERLVREGADINEASRPKGRITPLALAVKYDHADILSYLIGQEFFYKQPRLQTLSDAMALPTLDILQMLLEMKKPSGVMTNQARYGLQDAAWRGREDAIPLLLTYGVDIDYIHSGLREGTALQIARAHGHHSFARVLLENGARDETEPEQSPTKIFVRAFNRLSPSFP